MCFSYKHKRTKTVFTDDIRKSKRKKGRKGDKKVLALGGSKQYFTDISEG